MKVNDIRKKRLKQKRHNQTHIPKLTVQRSLQENNRLSTPRLYC